MMLDYSNRVIRLLANKSTYRKSFFFQSQYVNLPRYLHLVIHHIMYKSYTFWQLKHKNRAMLLLYLLVFIIVEKKGTFAIVSTSKLDFHCRSSLHVDPTRSSGWEICEIYVSWNFVRIPEVHMLGGSLNHSARDLRISNFAVAGNFIDTTYPFSPQKQRHQYSLAFHFFFLCVSVQ